MITHSGVGGFCTMMLYRASVGSLKTTSSNCQLWTDDTSSPVVAAAAAAAAATAGSVPVPPGVVAAAVAVAAIGVPGGTATTMPLLSTVHGCSLSRWDTEMTFSAASATKKIFIWISNSPQPVSETSNGGFSMTAQQRRAFPRPSVRGWPFTETESAIARPHPLSDSRTSRAA